MPFWKQALTVLSVVADLDDLQQLNTTSQLSAPYSRTANRRLAAGLLPIFEPVTPVSPRR